MRSIGRLAPLAVSIVMAACATSPAASGTSAATRPAQHNLVTAEELQPMSTVDLYTALTRIRPNFFRSRNVETQSNRNPTPVHVFVNGVRTEGPEALRLISAGSVQEVRFYEPQDANTRFGSGNNGGAVDVKLKP